MLPSLTTYKNYTLHPSFYVSDVAMSLFLYSPANHRDCLFFTLLSFSLYHITVLEYSELDNILTLTGVLHVFMLLMSILSLQPEVPLSALPAGQV